MNSKLYPFMLLFIFNLFQGFLAASRTLNEIYMFSVFGSYDCIGIFEDTYIVDDYN